MPLLAWVYLLQKNLVIVTDILKQKGSNEDFPNKNTKLFLGNSGTSFRPLTAVLTMMKGDYYLSGIDRMHERPIKRSCRLTFTDRTQI